VGVSYPPTTVTATGGTAPITWTAAGLPAGLSINVITGAITGTPKTASGNPYMAISPFSVTVTATDSASATATKNYSLNINVSGGPASASATFVKVDNTTQGTWKGVYGADGVAIQNDVTKYPSYAQVAFSGQSNYGYVWSTSNVRALQRFATSDRVAAVWYSNSSFTIDVNLTDGNTHQVALYCLDWDGGRVERIDVLDAGSNTVLDTQTAAGFQNGRYLVWNLKGHVTLRITNTGPSNAVVSGVFFR
jgi:hypothetical protein